MRILAVTFAAIVFASGCGHNLNGKPHLTKGVQMKSLATITTDEHLRQIAVDVHGSSVAIARDWKLDGLLLHLPEGQAVPVDPEILRQATSFAFSPDGKQLAATSPAGIRVWDCASGSVACRFDHALKGAGCLVFSLSEACIYFARCDRNSTLWRYDIRTNQARAIVCQHEGDALKDNAVMTIWDLAMAPDNKTLGITSDGCVLLYDIPSQKWKATMKHGQGGGQSVVFSPDGKVLALGGRKMLQLWDPQSSRLLDKRDDAVTAMTFSPDNEYLITGGDGTIAEANYFQVWRVKDMKLMHRSHSHDSVIVGLACMPNHRVVSASIDGIVKVWDLDTLVGGFSKGAADEQ